MKMIDKRKCEYKDFYWVFIKNALELTEGQTFHNEIGFVFYPNQYIFESLDVSDRYIVMIIPDDKHMHRTTGCAHSYSTTSVTIDKIMDLSRVETFEELWTDGVSMMDVCKEIISYLSYNSYYRPLSWFIDKCRAIHKDKFDTETFVKMMLCSAIEYNNLDLVDFIVYNLEKDLSKFSLDNDILISLSKLVANQAEKPDFCYRIIKKLLDYGFMTNLDSSSVIYQMFITMCYTLNHENTAELLKST